MTLSFPDLVPVELVDSVGITIGIFVAFVVILELIRWRSILSPIIRGMNLGVRKWLQILIGTLRSETIYQQIDIGYEKGKWLSHSLVMWGFLLLGVATTLNWIMDPKGYPLPIWHVVRISGNLGGLLFIVGLAIIVFRYASNEVKRDSVGASDYLFASLLIMAGITGFASEFASDLNANGTIYYIYASHLLFCAALLITAPLTKFIHAIGRPLLRLSENYMVALTSTVETPPLLFPMPKEGIKK
jgi:nitrate reductase gamma subunit